MNPIDKEPLSVKYKEKLKEEVQQIQEGLTEAERALSALQSDLKELYIQIEQALPEAAEMESPPNAEPLEALPTQMSEKKETGAEAEDPTKKESPPAEELTKEAKEKLFYAVRGLLAEKARAGHREQVRSLVLSHGGTQLSDYKDKPSILMTLQKEVEGL